MVATPHECCISFALVFTVTCLLSEPGGVELLLAGDAEWLKPHPIETFAVRKVSGKLTHE